MADFPTFIPMQKLGCRDDTFINIAQICSIQISDNIITVTTSDRESASVLRSDSAIYNFLYKLAHLEFE